jgi:septal ring factor EnvC (AmiA/AmiB activator)
MATTAAETIRLIGDTLTELDILAASPMLTDAEFKAVRARRRALDRKQLALVQSEFRENTQKFQKAADAVSEANGNLQNTIDDVTKVAETLAAVSVLISAVEKLLSIAIP